MNINKKNNIIYSVLFSINNLAASALGGLLGFGAANKDWIDFKIIRT